MTRFTPGPWAPIAAKKPDNVGGYDSAIMAGAYIIAEAYEVVADGVKMPVSANARLISSAPDMYEALKRLVEYYKGTTIEDDYALIIDQARAALSRAEGGT